MNRRTFLAALTAIVAAPVAFVTGKPKSVPSVPSGFEVYATYVYGSEYAPVGGYATMKALGQMPKTGDVPVTGRYNTTSPTITDVPYMEITDRPIISYARNAEGLYDRVWLKSPLEHPYVFSWQRPGIIDTILKYGDDGKLHPVTTDDLPPGAVLVKDNPELSQAIFKALNRDHIIDLPWELTPPTTAPLILTVGTYPDVQWIQPDRPSTNGYWANAKGEHLVP